MLLEAVYEQDFLPCSYGFRPGRSAHQALWTIRNAFIGRQMGLGWVVEFDIRRYYDTISHHHLRAFLDRRVTDGVIRRMIDKWLKAGVLEDGTLYHPTEGTPQGGVVSCVLANKGNGILVRYADDGILAFEFLYDAKRVLAALGKRLGRAELRISPFRIPVRSPIKPSGYEMGLIWILQGRMVIEIEARQP